MKNDEFEKAACAGSLMLAELSKHWRKGRAWDCSKERSFNYAVCGAAKPAYAAVPLVSYRSGHPCYVVAQGRSITDGGFGSSNGSTPFLNDMTEKEPKSEFQNKIKVLNMKVRIPS